MKLLIEARNDLDRVGSYVQEALQGLGLSDDRSDQPDDTIAAEPSL